MTNPFETIDQRLYRIEAALNDLTSRKDVPLEKKYYSVADAARKLNVAKITLYRNAKSGKFQLRKSARDS